MFMLPHLHVHAHTLSQEWDMSFATPYHSPSRSHQSALPFNDSMSDSPPLKQQRLFSPSPSPSTPEKPRPRRPLTNPFSLPSPSYALYNSPLRDATNGRNDIMMTSPPRIERLQLFDYPCTPVSLAKQCGMLSKESFLHR